MGGMNRSTMSRPGFQGMTLPSMLNTGGMLSSSMVGIPSPVNMHSGNWFWSRKLDVKTS